MEELWTVKLSIWVDLGEVDIRGPLEIELTAFGG